MTISTVTTETITGVADLKAGYTLGHADVAILKAISAELLAVREAQSDDINLLDMKPQEWFEALGKSPLMCAGLGVDVVQRMAAKIAILMQGQPTLNHSGDANEKVPAEMTADQAYQLLMEKGGVMSPVDAAVFAYNACRASILNSSGVLWFGFDPAQDYLPAIPDGNQVVPIEPTEAIINAGREIDSSPLNMSPRHRVELIYRAMLTEAPTPTKAGDPALICNDATDEWVRPGTDASKGNSNEDI